MKYRVFEDVLDGKIYYIPEDEVLTSDDLGHNYISFLGLFDLKKQKDLLFLFLMLVGRKNENLINGLIDKCGMSKKDFTKMVYFYKERIENGYNLLKNN